MKVILKLFLCFSGLFLVYDNCYCQVNIDALSGGSFDVEYCCTTPYQNYEIPFIAFKVSNLDYGASYSISLDSAEIFDVIGWESKSRYFIADGTYWKWNHPTITTDTIILEAQGDYANLELDTYQCFRMGISHLGIGDLAGVCIFIKTSMSISGPSLDCDNPVSYNLLNIPDDLASAEWELKQYSITRDYGSGTTATSDGYLGGSGTVIFTTSFSCPLNDVTLDKDFWFGKPYINPATIQFECTDGSGYLCANAFGNEFSFIFDWPYNNFNIKLTNLSETQTYDQFTIYDTWGTIDCSPPEGTHMFHVRGNNECGTATNWSKKEVEYVDCGMGGLFSLEIYPNPTEEEATVSIISAKDRTKIIDLDEDWQLEVYTQGQLLKYSIPTIIDDKYVLNTSGWKAGMYFIRVFYKDEVLWGRLIVNE